MKRCIVITKAVVLLVLITDVLFADSLAIKLPIPSETVGDEFVLDSVINVLEDVMDHDPEFALSLSQPFLMEAMESGDMISQIKLLVFQGWIHKQNGDYNKWLTVLDQAEVQSSDLEFHSAISKLFYAKASHSFLIGDVSNSKKYTEKSIAVASGANDGSGLSRAYNHKGIFYQTEPDSAFYYYNEAYDLAAKVKDTIMLIRSLSNLAWAEKSLNGQDNKALEIWREHDRLCAESNRKKDLSHSFSNQAGIYRDKQEFSKAIELQIKSIGIAREFKNTYQMLNGNQSLANIYKYMERREDALEYFHKAIDMSKETQISTYLPSIYNNLATLYMGWDIAEMPTAQDSALIYLKKCMEVSDERTKTLMRGAASLNIGSIYKYKREYAQGEKYILEGFDLLRQTGRVRTMNQGAMAAAEFYIAWFQDSISHDFRVDKLKEIESNLRSIEEYAENNGHAGSQENVYLAFTGIYELLQDYYNMSLYAKKLIVLKDSSLVKANVYAANEWAEKFKTQEKENEILQLEAENRIATIRNKNYLMALIGTAIFFVILGYVNSKYQKQKSEKKRIEQAQLFRSRLSSDLHDEVGSMLSSLSLRAQMIALRSNDQTKSDVNELADISQSAIESLRDTVWAIDSRKDKYENLLDRMSEYAQKNLSLKHIEFNLIKKNWKENRKIDIKKRQNIYLIFKEAITNILKHSNGDKVDITLDQSEKEFTLSILDNGDSLSDAPTDGLGLSNMKQRAKEIGAQISFLKNKGYEVLLKMPL